MKYLLDTDTCIFIIKRAPESLYAKFKKLKVGDVGVSAITYCELQFGVSRSSRPEKNQEILNEFLGPLEIMDFPAEAALLYGVIRGHLANRGKQIGPYDLLIAAHALFMGSILVTNNLREFQRVPDLVVENWV